LQFLKKVQNHNGLFLLRQVQASRQWWSEGRKRCRRRGKIILSPILLFTESKKTGKALGSKI